MTATRADVERAVSGRPGRGPRNGRVWDGDVRARSRRWFKACVPDDEIPGLGGGGAARESCHPPVLDGVGRRGRTVRLPRHSGHGRASVRWNPWDDAPRGSFQGATSG